MPPSNLTRKGLRARGSPKSYIGTSTLRGRLSLPLSSSLSPAKNFFKSFKRFFGSNIISSSSAAIKANITKEVNGVLNSFNILKFHNMRAIALNSLISPSSKKNNIINNIFNKNISIIKGIKNKTKKYTSGLFSTIGDTVSKNIIRTLNGLINFSGITNNKIKYIIENFLNTIGVANVGSRRVLILNGIIEPISNINYKVKKIINRIISSTGKIQNNISRLFSKSLSILGGIFIKPNKIFGLNILNSSSKLQNSILVKIIGTLTSIGFVTNKVLNLLSSSLIPAKILNSKVKIIIQRSSNLLTGLIKNKIKIPIKINLNLTGISLERGQNVKTFIASIRPTKILNFDVDKKFIKNLNVNGTKIKVVRIISISLLNLSKNYLAILKQTFTKILNPISNITKKTGLDKIGRLNINIKSKLKGLKFTSGIISSSSTHSFNIILGLIKRLSITSKNVKYIAYQIKERLALFGLTIVPGASLELTLQNAITPTGNLVRKNIFYILNGTINFSKKLQHRFEIIISEIIRIEGIVKNKIYQKITARIGVIGILIFRGVRLIIKGFISKVMYIRASLKKIIRIYE